MPDDVGGAEEEKLKLGKITKQINAQEETLQAQKETLQAQHETIRSLKEIQQSLFAEVQDLKAKLRGYDYEGGDYKDLAVDPETKALLTMNPPIYFLLDGSREAEKIIITDGAGHYLQLPKLTTAQRDLLTAVNGMAIYNTDTKQIEFYENGAWGVLFPAELKKLTTVEIQQLKNIGTTPISAAQWGILGAAVEWTAWTPTLTGGADLSGYDTARYFRIGDICFFYFSAVAQNVTTAGVIQITLPFTAANTGGYQAITGTVHDGSAWVGQTIMWIQSNTNYISVYKTVAAGSWAGTETGVNIHIAGFFEIA